MNPTVIIDEGALTETAQSIRAYIQEIKERLETAIRGIQANSGDWDDEDFNKLLSALQGCLNDFSGLEESGAKIIERVGVKINQIHELHSMSI